MKRIEFYTYILLTLFFALFLFLFCDCSSLRNAHKTKTDVERQETQNKKIDIVEKQQNNIDSIITLIDTTKKKTNESTVKNLTIIEKQYTDGQIAKEKQTNYKETKLFISDEDLYMIKNGYYKDSSEFADKLAYENNSSIINDSTNIIQDKKIKKSKYATNIVTTIILFIIIVLFGWWIYNKFKRF